MSILRLIFNRAVKKSAFQRIFLDQEIPSISSLLARISKPSLCEYARISSFLSPLAMLKWLYFFGLCHPKSNFLRHTQQAHCSRVQIVKEPLQH
jgi:hypothetical protein